MHVMLCLHMHMATGEPKCLERDEDVRKSFGLRRQGTIKKSEIPPKKLLEKNPPKKLLVTSFIFFETLSWSLFVFGAHGINSNNFVFLSKSSTNSTNSTSETTTATSANFKRQFPATSPRRTTPPANIIMATGGIFQGTTSYSSGRLWSRRRRGGTPPRLTAMPTRSLNTASAARRNSTTSFTIAKIESSTTFLSRAISVLGVGGSCRGSKMSSQYLLAEPHLGNVVAATTTKRCGDGRRQGRLDWRT